MKIGEEGGSKDITRPCRVNLFYSIGREAFCFTVAEEGCAMSSISGDEQGYMHTPARQDGIGLTAVAVGEGQQIIMAENQRIEQRQNLFCFLPGCRPDAAI